MTRLNNYLTEWEYGAEIDSRDYKDLKNIMVECSDMYNLYKKEKRFFYRGVDNRIDIWIKKEPWTRRRSRLMPDHVKQYLDDWSEKKFGWRMRDGVFATSFKDMVDKEFGHPNIIFVPNGFKYIWSPDFYDLNLEDGSSFVDSIDNMLDGVSGFREDIRIGLASFTNKDIADALHVQNEISFKCPHYYLINNDVIKDTNNMQWIYNVGGG